MTRSRRWPDLAIAAFAVALIVTGAVAVFVVDNGAGVAALLAVGSILLVVVALGDRIESLRWGELELTLRRQADAAAAAGDRTMERELRAAADGLVQRAAPMAGSYEFLRGSMRAGPDRTAAMEAEVARAREDAGTADLTSEGLAKLFQTGTDGERIMRWPPCRNALSLQRPRSCSMECGTRVHRLSTTTRFGSHSKSAPG